MSSSPTSPLTGERMNALGQLVCNACQQVWVAVHNKPAECIIVTLSVKTIDGTSTYALVNRDALDGGVPPATLIEDVERVVDEYAHSLPNVLRIDTQAPS